MGNRNIKSEDTAHSSGDQGSFILAVRKDTAAAQADNGDYHPLLVDSTGKLHVTTGSGGDASAANQSTIIGHVDGIEGLIGTTNTKIDTLDAVVDLILTKAGEIDTAVDTIDGVLDNILTKNGEIDTAIDTLDAVVDNILTAVQVMDDWDASNTARVTSAPASPVWEQVTKADDLANGATLDIIAAHSDGTTLYITDIIFGSLENAKLVTFEDTSGADILTFTTGSSAATAPLTPLHFQTPIKIGAADRGLRILNSSGGNINFTCTAIGFYI